MSRPEKLKNTVEAAGRKDDEADVVNIAAASGVGGERERAVAVEDVARPVGNRTRILGIGEQRRTLYEAFTYNGKQFRIDDSVYLAPQEPKRKPGIAIIKGIAMTPDQKVVVTGQMLYHPGEVGVNNTGEGKRKDTGYWKPHSRREVFYSFNREEFPAELVMHKIVLHFIPQNKQVPPRRQHPGLIVQKIYDMELKRQYNLTDITERKFGRMICNEIDRLTENTKSRLGNLPNVRGARK